MKRVSIILFCALSLLGCGKMGKDGRFKQQVDWTKWYYDDETGEAEKPSVMVMSFNVRYGTAVEAHEEDSWNNRRDACCAMVNTVRPVTMGVQECMLFQRDYLKNHCPDYEVVGVSRDDSEDGEQTAIFYLKDSVTVTDWGTFWLSETPNVVSKHNWAGNYRTATWVKATHIKTGNIFYHINTHLDLKEEVRGFEMEVIMDFIRNNCASYPIVLTADWNTGENDEIFADMYLTFQNARATAVTGDAYGTTNWFEAPTKERLDHIFYRGFSSCSKFITVTQPWEGHKFISDHYPVYTILQF